MSENKLEIEIQLPQAPVEQPTDHSSYVDRKGLKVKSVVDLARKLIGADEETTES